MKRLVLPLMIAAVIGTGVLAVTQFRANSHLKAQLDRVSAELAAQQDALTRLSAEKQASDVALASSKEDNQRLKKERDEAKSRQLRPDLNSGGKDAVGATQQGGKQKPLDLRGMFQGFAKRLDDPETRRTMKQGQQRMVAAAYEPLFKQLGLSEQESNLAAELIAERNFAVLDKGRKILDGGAADDAAVSAVRKEIDAAEAESDAKLKTVLGAQKFEELTAYEQTLGDQRALDFFTRNFNAKSQPLAPEQKGALAEIMRQERLKSPTNEIPDLGGGPGISVLMTDAELEARNQREQAYQQRVISRGTEAGLSPDQIAILQDSFKQRSEWRDFGARMGRAFIRPQQ